MHFVSKIAPPIGVLTGSDPSKNVLNRALEITKRADASMGRFSEPVNEHKVAKRTEYGFFSHFSAVFNSEPLSILNSHFAISERRMFMVIKERRPKRAIVEKRLRKVASVVTQREANVEFDF